MTASRDTERLIRAFLDEGVTELPDRVYDAVRSDIDRTHQRVVIGPWRTPDMNTFAKFATAAAAVLVVAFLGFNVLPGGTGRGGAPDVSPSPSITPSQSTSASSSPPPEPSGDIQPPRGALEPGVPQTVSRSDVRLTFAVPADGWSSDGSFWFDREGPDMAKMWIFAPTGTPGIFTDPCAHTGLRQFDRSIVGDADAIAALPGIEVVDPPADDTVGGKPARSLAIVVPSTVGCSVNQYWLSHVEECGIKIECTYYPDWFGATMRYWFVDVDGTRLTILISAYTGGGGDITQEIAQIVDSIRFE